MHINLFNINLFNIKDRYLPTQYQMNYVIIPHVLCGTYILFLYILLISYITYIYYNITNISLIYTYVEIILI